MSKKDYIKIAGIFKDRNTQRTDWNTEMLMLATDIARVLREDNENFDESIFLRSCGFIDEYKLDI